MYLRMMEAVEEMGVAVAADRDKLLKMVDSTVMVEVVVVHIHLLLLHQLVE